MVCFERAGSSFREGGHGLSGRAAPFRAVGRRHSGRVRVICHTSVRLFGLSMNCWCSSSLGGGSSLLKWSNRVSSVLS